ncbi:uncharacterized protein (TIGR00299 family) protein [Virgibacillus natechei]|uniref:Uncharacterized protein (TIGR00299 family) protein n=1 Tax=Virgibacillus natechei TaxID=1216297 RepID=A0ABS4IDN5_9BACI|nr:LarC family nickel insertion protein [Virgibacillus natechei]MBP1968561.1 uncharacterized protein (TIGR00299 family) protein [Virgibacillus natechei]UZD13672.1 LarC family nickel insertion protein [Virgibacillus natechei]
MKILYFDCFSGISGDMTIGSLINAGADITVLESELKKLQMEDEYELKTEKVVKNGITSTKFDVVLLNEEHHHHDHDHKHEHHHDGHDHGHHAHTNNHDHSHEHHHHHRSYRDIVKLIESADFPEQVKDMALKIFKKIGEAEGKIHGVPLADVHFHEVGAVDSIIDIVGSAILIHNMEIDEVRSSSIPVGSGKIHIDHGVYPVPAPATLEILKGVPLAHSDLKAELTTPTGAAIIAVLAEKFSNLPSMNVHAIGYGAGTKSFENHPNVLRIIIGE